MSELPKCMCLSSSSVLGAGTLYFVSSTIIQMVSRGFTSREFAGRSSFAIRLTSVRRLFRYKAFQPLLVTFQVHHAVVLETLIL